LGAGPGYDICIKGTAKLMNAFLYTEDPETNLMISMVCRAATADVVVLNAAIIFPAFNLASIHVH
jgi:hypothetical protein